MENDAKVHGVTFISRILYAFASSGVALHSYHSQSSNRLRCWTNSIWVNPYWKHLYTLASQEREDYRDFYSTWNTGHSVNHGGPYGKRLENLALLIRINDCNHCYIIDSGSDPNKR